MARRSESTQVKPAHIPQWVSVPLWTDLSPGDPVKVSGEFGAFTFRAVHVKEEEVIAVHVYGGSAGNMTNRFFAPERVTKIWPKGTRKPRATKSAVKK